MKQSAGILMYRRKAERVECLLVHPGGPFFARKDAGSWTIPKGEIAPGEEALAAACREFEEETGYRPEGNFIPLQPVVQKGGKQVMCWAVEGELDAASIVSNTFELEWPPRSGKLQLFPEVDKASWFGLEEAKKHINERQVAFIEELLLLLS